jgi:hypothetical protein
MRGRGCQTGKLLRSNSDGPLYSMTCSVFVPMVAYVSCQLRTVRCFHILCTFAEPLV